MAFTGFAKNYQTKWYIGKDKDTLYPVSGGITSAEGSFDEDTDEYSYLDGNGSKEKESKGKTSGFKYAGNRKYGNLAQDFVRDRLLAKDNTCYMVAKEPDGSQLQGAATISEITPFGGDAIERSTFEFSVTWAGAAYDFKADGTERNGRSGETMINVERFDSQVTPPNNSDNNSNNNSDSNNNSNNNENNNDNSGNTSNPSN